MIIDNPEALRLWLEDYLPPLCDADPEVLARYCLALIRKDRKDKDEDLKISMIEALDVFLKENTNGFVDVFVSVVRSKSYIPKVVTAVVANDVSPVVKETTPLVTETVTANVEFTPPSADAMASVTTPQPLVAPVTVASTALGQPPLPTAPPPDITMPHPPPESSPPMPLSHTRKEDVVPPVKQRKDVDRDERRRRRSSSRTRDRARRSRSRGRSSRNKYDDRRRRSPHSKRYRRTRSRSRSPRRSRSPAGRSRSRDRRSRSAKSTSPKRSARHRSRSRSPFTKTAVQISPSKSPIKDAEESNSREAPLNDKEGPGSTHQRHGGKFSSKSRCRDYDEQGFCMRGDQCLFDHGSDPVVLEGAALEFPPPMTTVAAPSTTNYTAPPPTPVVGQDIGGRPLMPHPPPLRGTHIGEYTPNNPGIWSGDNIPNMPIFYGSGRGMAGTGPRYTAPPPSIPPPDSGRELISVDINSHSKTGAHPPPKRMGQIHSNGSFNVVKNPKYGDNCTLEMKKIPPGMNNIALLNQHFAKFGKITNIQIHHGGDPEGALVTFCNNSEASAAYRSTEAVLNNRFIKIFWHNPHKTESSSAAVNPRNIHDRLGNRHPNKSLNNKAPDDRSEKVTLTKGGLMKTVYNLNAMQTQSSEVSTAMPDSTQQSAVVVPSTDEVKKMEIEAITKQQDLLKAEIDAHNKKEKKKAEAIKLKTEVEQRTRQLLDKQMAQVKVLVNKLDTNRATMKLEEMKSLVGTIKSLQSAVDATKARLFATPPASVTPTAPIKSKCELDKDILDTELELYNVQSDDGDITRLRSRVQQLKVQMTHLKGKNSAPPNFAMQRGMPYPVRGRGFSRGAPRRARGRGRGYVLAPNAVDRRSTTIHVSGFEKEDKDEVLTHFAALGTVTNYTWDRHTPSISVQFATRRDGERAILEGRNLQDRLLTLTWTHSNAQEEAIIPGTEASAIKASNPDDHLAHSTTNSGLDESDEITEEIIVVEETIDGEEELLLYDDDDESEGRSWRR